MKQSNKENYTDIAFRYMKVNFSFLNFSKKIESKKRVTPKNTCKIWEQEVLIKRLTICTLKYFQIWQTLGSIFCCFNQKIKSLYKYVHKWNPILSQLNSYPILKQCVINNKYFNQDQSSLGFVIVLIINHNVIIKGLFGIGVYTVWYLSEEKHLIYY